MRKQLLRQQGCLQPVSVLRFPPPPYDLITPPYPKSWSCGGHVKARSARFLVPQLLQEGEIDGLGPSIRVLLPDYPMPCCSKRSLAYSSKSVKA